jgi:transposase
MRSSIGKGLCETIDRTHASECTRIHALYAFYFLGMQQSKVADVYRKSAGTISKWIAQYEKTGTVSRQSLTDSRNRKYGPMQRAWLRDYFLNNPLSFLDEAKVEFETYWHRDISLTSVWRILREFNFTRKGSAIHRKTAV